MSRKRWIFLSLLLLGLLGLTVVPYNLWCWSYGISSFGFSSRGTLVWAVLWLFILFATAALLGVHFFQHKDRYKNLCRKCHCALQSEWRVCPYCGTSRKITG